METNYPIFLFFFKKSHQYGNQKGSFDWTDVQRYHQWENRMPGWKEHTQEIYKDYSRWLVPTVTYSKVKYIIVNISPSKRSELVITCTSL